MHEYFFITVPPNRVFSVCLWILVFLFLLHAFHFPSIAPEHSFSSYYIVVVFIDPLQGLYAILFGDTVDWFHFPTT